MELNKSNIKKILGIVAFAALFYTGLQQWDRVSAFAGKIFGYFFPFLLGGGIWCAIHLLLYYAGRGKVKRRRADQVDKMNIQDLG